MIQVFSNSLGPEELEAIKGVFKSRWVGSCSKVEQFEGYFATHLHEVYPGVAWLDPKHDVFATNSCTSALSVALRALGIGCGDEVIIPTINFIGCANLVLMVGACPVFADVDLDYFQVLPGEIERLKTSRTKAVILLHYGGHPCNMDAIYEECNGIHIIEDSANSISSKYKGVRCGVLGDAGVFSFDAMKTLVTGDGGMLAIKKEFSNEAFSYRYLGMKPKSSSGIDSLSNNKSRWWEFDTVCPSDRNTMNDITASIGIEQLKKLPGFIQKRKDVWRVYQNELPYDTPEPRPNTESSYYLYWIKDSNRDDLARYLIDNGIYCTFRYYPLHKVFGHEPLRNADFISETALNLPIHQNLSEDEVGKIVDRVKKFKRRTGK